MKSVSFAPAGLSAAVFALMTVAASADQPVAINFAAEIGGTAFSCAGTYEGIGAAATTLTGTDYRIFVSEPALVRADGTTVPVVLDQDGQWQFENVALLDFEDGTGGCAGAGNAGLNTTLRGTAPDGDYVGLAFTIGIPFELNHIDPTLAAAPLNTTAMFWTWQDGFRFVTINLTPVAMPMPAPAEAPAAGAATAPVGADAAAAAPASGMDMGTGWFLHVGSTQCAGRSQTEAPTACANPNRIAVVFPAFDPATNVVVIDPAPVVAEADMTVNAADTAPGCMAFPGDADCMTVMGKLGLPYDGVPAGDQLLATVR